MIPRPIRSKIIQNGFRVTDSAEEVALRQRRLQLLEDYEFWFDFFGSSATPPSIAPAPSTTTSDDRPGPVDHHIGPVDRPGPVATLLVRHPLRDLRRPAVPCFARAGAVLPLDFDVSTILLLAIQNVASARTDIANVYTQDVSFDGVVLPARGLERRRAGAAAGSHAVIGQVRRAAAKTHRREAVFDLERYAADVKFLVRRVLALVLPTELRPGKEGEVLPAFFSLERWFRFRGDEQEGGSKARLNKKAVLPWANRELGETDEYLSCATTARKGKTSDACYSHLTRADLAYESGAISEEDLDRLMDEGALRRLATNCRYESPTRLTGDRFVRVIRWFPPARLVRLLLAESSDQLVSSTSVQCQHVADWHWSVEDVRPVSADAQFRLRRTLALDPPGYGWGRNDGRRSSHADVAEERGSCLTVEMIIERSRPTSPDRISVEGGRKSWCVRASVRGPARCQGPQAAVVFAFVDYAERLNAVLSLEEEGEFTCDLSF